jgi:hypothetical protein
MLSCCVVRQMPFRIQRHWLRAHANWNSTWSANQKRQIAQALAWPFARRTPAFADFRQGDYIEFESGSLVGRSFRSDIS